MTLTWTMASAAVLLACAAPAAAELPIPPLPAATQQADAYLFHGGAGDVFEITSSMIALDHSTNPQVRAFATMLIGDHTNLTNAALATAKGVGVMAPPPVLSPTQMGMISQLTAAGPNFDRVYLQQQLAAHQQALAMQTAYAQSGDVAALRAAAASAAPVIRGHLDRVQQMLNGM
jgi:putative membrane protein